MTDVVNHPSHYTQYKGLEVIELTRKMDFDLGNAVKYIARAGLKDPSTEIQDLEKAIWYVEDEIVWSDNPEPEYSVYGDLPSILAKQLRPNLACAVEHICRESNADLQLAVRYIRDEIDRIRR